MTELKIPTTRSFTVTAPRVLVSLNGGEYTDDSNLIAREVRIGEGLDTGSAQLEINLATISLADAMDYYNTPGLYVIIQSGDEVSGNEDPFVFFHGRAQKTRWGLSGSEGKITESLILPLEHVSMDLEDQVIYGRMVHMDTWNPGTGYSKISNPCLMNYNGLANRSASLISIPVSNGSQSCPVFSGLRDGYDANAKLWNAAAALIYCIAWHSFSTVDFTQFLQVATTYMDSLSSGDGLQKVLTNPMPPTNLEGMNLRKAIDTICKTAGIKYRYADEYIDDKLCCTFEYWWEGNGEEKNVYLEAPRLGEEDKRTAEEVLAANNINQALVETDWSKAVTNVMVIGSPLRVELTAELVPGWPKDGTLDSVSDKETAKKEAIKHLSMTQDDIQSDDWFLKYHYASKSATAKTLQYSRLWVLNEDGHYTDRGAYDIGIKLGLNSLYTSLGISGTVINRPRQFLDALSGSETGRSYGVVVELSYDGGGTWYLHGPGIRNLPDRCGVVLAMADPIRMCPPGGNPTDINAWFALLDGQFRVRVTASIELDSCVMATATNNAGYGRTIVIRDDQLRYWKRLNSNFSGYAEEYDDFSTAREKAELILLGNQRWKIPSQFVIPWLESRYHIGDYLLKIAGREIYLAKSYGELSSEPMIAGLVWRFGTDWSTEILTQDLSLDSDHDR